MNEIQYLVKICQFIWRRKNRPFGAQVIFGHIKSMFGFSVDWPPRWEWKKVVNCHCCHEWKTRWICRRFTRPHTHMSIRYIYCVVEIKIVFRFSFRFNSKLYNNKQSHDGVDILYGSLLLTCSPIHITPPINWNERETINIYRKHNNTLKYKWTTSCWYNFGKFRCGRKMHARAILHEITVCMT